MLQLKQSFLAALILLGFVVFESDAQSFSTSNLDFNGLGGVSAATSLMYGPDGRLYVLNRDGIIDIFTIQRIALDDYQVIASEELTQVKSIPNHNDDGTNSSTSIRQATGMTVAGTASNPIIYVASSDSRTGGPAGDLNLDTNSGVITRLTKNGGSWYVVDIVRGLPRSEENHATNGMEFVTIGGTDVLIACQGGHTNAGSPSRNFAWLTEFALAAAVISIDLTMIEGMQILNDGIRQYIYDIPTLDDPSRLNVNGITDPDDLNYNGIDVNDPWGGNDGLNQAMIVAGGPVQIFSPGFRNAYDLVLTQSGAVFVTDNGANQGWGGLPDNEGTDSVSNRYLPGEPGSSSPVGGEQVNNVDHLTLVTTDIQNYTFNSFYGGHPNPIRANPSGAGLYTNPSANDTIGAIFRTLTYDPDGSTPGSTTNASIALPANWPPVSIADAVQSDWRAPGGNNPDGENDILTTTWGTNTNGIDEYTASNFNGAMQGDLIAGTNMGELRRLQLNPDGSPNTLTNAFASNLGGNALGITCNSDTDPFPGTIWIATFNNNIVVLEPQDSMTCLNPGDPGYDPNDDYDFDGYTNQDEIDNETDICNGSSQPQDFDKSAGGSLVSDLNDTDDDNDSVLDADDPMQLGDPLDAGSDAFTVPVNNELFSDQPDLKGYLGLGLTGLMNNGDPNPNWLNWLDQIDAGPNPNDILGGAIGVITMQMTSGTADGSANNQEKGFQFGVEVDQSLGMFTIESQMLNFTDPLQLYGSATTVDAPDAEIGIQIGDGTQSNFVKFVLNQTGFELYEEDADAASEVVSNVISMGNRPSNSTRFFLKVDPSDGTITAKYSFDFGPLQTLGSITAQGVLLQAIQQSATPLIVGVSGSSKASNKEVEGTWDYIKVLSSAPTIANVLPNLTRLINDPSDTIDLDYYFDDDEGAANLIYTIELNSDPSIVASISSNTLILDYPSTPATSMLTIRATDQQSLYIDQTFTVDVTAERTVLFRVNAGDVLVTATDAPNPDWAANTGTGAQSGTGFEVNTGNIGTYFITNRNASVPSYAPTALFTKERWDPPTDPEMEWTFNTGNGTFIVNFFMGNGFDGTMNPGERIFDVNIEGNLVIDDKDLSAQYGHQVGAMESYQVQVADDVLNIEFIHQIQNPLINAIEIIGAGNVPPITVDPIADQTDDEGDNINIQVVASGGKSSESFTFSQVGLPPGLQIDMNTGLISGIIAAGASTGSPYNVTITVDKPSSVPVDLEFIYTVLSGGPQITWTDQSDDENYTARHECSFVQAGDKFYLFGGRENSQTLDIYNYQSKTWSSLSNSAPLPFNHFQAVEYQGLIWVIGAFADNGFPNETPAEHVWAYNPASDTWIQGPEVPVGRRRGSAGLVLYNDKFYIVGGNTDGHAGGYIKYFDEFDPATGIWTPLADAPNDRDHFHAAVANEKLYVAGGRKSGGAGGTFAPLVPEVDVYDFTTSTWSTLAASLNLPTPRAGTATVNFQGEIYVIGGEGNGLAYKTTETFDPSMNVWSSKDSMNFARHGTQGIVSGDGIHIASGSPNQGGGNQKNMEFYGTDNPQGVPLVASMLSYPQNANVDPGNTVNIPVSNTGGNVGLLITNLHISGMDSMDFEITSDTGFQLINSGEMINIVVDNVGTEHGKTAILTITYDGGATAVIILNYCPTDLTIDTSPSTGYFGASNSIMTNPGIQITSDAIYDAPSVIISGEFAVLAMATFEIRVDGCNN